MGGLHKQRAYEQVRYSFCYAFMVFTPSKDSTIRAQEEPVLLMPMHAFSNVVL